MQTNHLANQVLLIDLILPGESLAYTTDRQQELRSLATTRGLDVTDLVVQKRQQPDPKSFIGKGKWEIVQTLLQQKKAGGLLFGRSLTPSQMKNIQRWCKCPVWDHTLLILEIFEKQAQTKRARLQVALAHKNYLLPRLTNLWTHLSRQRGGGVRMRGTGEKELETDRRKLQQTIHKLKTALKRSEKQAAIGRKQRHRAVNVSLVGYTNAGKSTLMGALADPSIKGQNRLFATLETTVRRTSVEGIPYLLADTVGFIQALPTGLLSAFQSTLAEVCQADLLLHVVDINHPRVLEQIQTVHATLEKIGAGKIPRLLVYNQWDCLTKRVGTFAAQQQLAAVKEHFPKESGVVSVGTDPASLGPLRHQIKASITDRFFDIYPNKILHNSSKKPPFN